MTACTLEVRVATFADVPGISRIERESFSDPWSARSFVESLTNERMRFLVVAEHDGQQGGDAELGVLGFVIALVLTDEAEIADIAVAERARRRGVGGLLLDSVILQAQREGVRSMYLEVRESNVAAQALYRSRAFLQVGRRRGYYHHPDEDALLLKREYGTT
jgi:ribosomal-protein-alanine N-acetyltransferase